MAIAGVKDALATPPSWLFGGLVALKNLLYDSGLAKIDRLDRPVLSVGNLAMGGTGKTPVTAELVRLFSAAGQRTAVLSRGYGRRHSKSRRQVSADDNWRDSGDEPLMLARRHPEAAVCVGPSRFAAAQCLKEPPDLYLIDDGFQHRQLHRDLDIVLLDASGPMPKLFPRGLYREGWSALKRADVAVLTRCDLSNQQDQWRASVAAVNPHLPILALSFEAGNLCTLNNQREESLDFLRGKRIAAFCGIAKPQPFFTKLTELGAEIVEKRVLNDHQPLTNSQQNGLRTSCLQKKLDAVITTEKDAVKLDPATDFGVSLFFLKQVVSWRGESAVDLIVKPFVN